MMSGSPAAVLARLARARSLLAICEFDGTLAEFVTDPTTARPVEGALGIVAALASLPRTRAALISGRSLESLRAVFGAGDAVSEYRIELVGSGGMEIESRLTLGLTADARRAQRRLLQEAEQIADAHPGVTIDEKPYGVALHVRGAATGDGQRAIELLLDVAHSMPQPVYSQSRNEVLDMSVLPVGQDWAIDALRHGAHATVFYAGNDERALASLAPTDVSCTVGEGCTDASMRVTTPSELVMFLTQLRGERARLLDAQRGTVT